MLIIWYVYICRIAWFTSFMVPKLGVQGPALYIGAIGCIYGPEETLYSNTTPATDSIIHKYEWRHK